MTDTSRFICLLFVCAAIVITGCGKDSFSPSSQALAESPPPEPAEVEAIRSPSPPQPVLDARDFYLGEEGLTPSERAGREIWYKATAGNARFHTYVFQQRVNVMVDWYRVLNARDHADRFKAWGLINDPGCCIPGDEGCPARSLDETYGFEWCPGDDQLLPYVGREGYRDPACDFRDAPLDPSDPHAGAGDQRQSPCDLAFGTSTGALGYRKFPNPRFDRARWLAVNSSLASWEGYRGRIFRDGPPSDADRNRLADGSIEPPFLIGTSCGSCHIAFDPLNPPDDPANPRWENLKGTIGNQYTRVSEILTSGMPGNTLEVQMFSYTRPGTTDTSAVPSDQVYNPGTMNAIINTSVRPVFTNEQVLKWREVESCGNPAGGKPDEDDCWCEPGRTNKCWRRSLQSETVHHILKGGEDSIGARQAVQRVYFNIGSCSEQCWLNHLTDLRQLDPTMRNFGQTPFDIGQCRRDCPNFRAIEDRLGNIVDFLMSPEANATDLRAARERAMQKSNPSVHFTQVDLVRELEGRFGNGAVDRGRVLFAANCARCHSSIPVEQGGDFAGRDFLAVGEHGLRADWMGSDRPTPVTEVGTSRCRALHSNHMTGHIWEQFGSETLRAQPPVQGIEEPHDGGRGYYRNISLLSAWAHAPFMHNNAIGPELCGQPTNAANDFYRSPYVDGDGKALPAGQAPACWAYDPSVDGRFRLYVASMTELLNPAARTPKISRFDHEVRIALGPRTWDAKEEKQVAGFALVLPAGTSVDGVASFQHKALVNDLVLAKLHPDKLAARLNEELGEQAGAAFAAELRELAAEIVSDPERLVDALRAHVRLADYYSSCTEMIENSGHPFGEGLSAADKKALIAFVATL